MSSRSLSKVQRDKLTQFVGVTGASTRAATECLRLHRWDIDPAVDYWYSTAMAAQHAQRAGPRVDRAAIEQLFERYKDADSNAAMADGIMRLCEDLGVDPEDIVMLVLSWHLKAATMGEYSRQEFEDGLARLEVDSIDKLRAKLPALRAELDEPRTYREIYSFAYGFSCEKGQKCVQLDMAVAMWQVLVSLERWRYINEWCDFLRAHHGRAVSKDTWAQLLDFMVNINDDFSNYDENGAWPYLIDEFVNKLQQENGAASSDS